MAELDGECEILYTTVKMSYIAAREFSTKTPVICLPFLRDAPFLKETFCRVFLTSGIAGGGLVV